MTAQLSKLCLAVATAYCSLNASASATTLDAVTLGDVLFPQREGLVSTSNNNFIVEPTIFIMGFFTFALAPIIDGGLDETRTTPSDLLTLVPEQTASGTAIDIGVNTEADVISILFELTRNEVNDDEFAVAVVGFSFDIEEDALSDLDNLNSSLVDFEILFATENQPVADVPLPASAIFLCAGLALMRHLRRRGT
ncbi:MAG: VPLPA-CTERM sorting domain-containing protein [Pseudomonadota bacterium]